MLLEGRYDDCIENFKYNISVHIFIYSFYIYLYDRHILGQSTEGHAIKRYDVFLSRDADTVVHANAVMMRDSESTSQCKERECTGNGQD